MLLLIFHNPRKTWKCAAYLNNGTVLKRLDSLLEHQPLVFWNDVPDEAEAARYQKMALNALKWHIKNFEHKVVSVIEIFEQLETLNRLIRVVLDVIDKKTMTVSVRISVERILSKI